MGGANRNKSHALPHAVCRCAALRFHHLSLLPSQIILWFGHFETGRGVNSKGVDSLFSNHRLSGTAPQKDNIIRYTDHKKGWLSLLDGYEQEQSSNLVLPKKH